MIRFVHTLDAANTLLSQGEVLIYPTETLWGMGASIESKKAIQKIFRLKNRTSTQPVSLLVKDIEMAKQYTSLTEPVLNLYENSLARSSHFCYASSTNCSKRNTCRNTLCWSKVFLSSISSKTHGKKKHTNYKHKR